MNILEVQSKFENNPTVKCLSQGENFQIISSSIYKSEDDFFYAIDANDNNNLVVVAYRNSIAKIAPTKQPKEYDKSFGHVLLILREKIRIAEQIARQSERDNQPESAKNWQAKYWEISRAIKAIKDLQNNI